VLLGYPWGCPWVCARCFPCGFPWRGSTAVLTRLPGILCLARPQHIDEKTIPDAARPDGAAAPDDQLDGLVPGSDRDHVSRRRWRPAEGDRRQETDDNMVTGLVDLVSCLGISVDDDAAETGMISGPDRGHGVRLRHCGRSAGRCQGSKRRSEHRSGNIDS
jgi:hypothetical protein